MPVTKHEIPTLNGRWNYILCADLPLKNTRTKDPRHSVWSGPLQGLARLTLLFPRSDIPGSISIFSIYPLLCYPSNFELKVRVLSSLISFWCSWLSWWKRSSLWHPTKLNQTPILGFPYSFHLLPPMSGRYDFICMLLPKAPSRTSVSPKQNLG